MKIEERTPLAWPGGWSRTNAGSRSRSNFADHTVAGALDFVCDELRRLRCDTATVTANAFLRKINAALEMGLKQRKAA